MERPGVNGISEFMRQLQKDGFIQTERFQYCN